MPPPNSKVLNAKAAKVSSPHPRAQVNSAVIRSAAVGIPTMSDGLLQEPTFYLTREETDAVVDGPGLFRNLSKMKIHQCLGHHFPKVQLLREVRRHLMIFSCSNSVLLPH